MDTAVSGSGREISTCAVVGLGRMGSGIAHAQQLAGRTVYGHDLAAGPQIDGVQRVGLEQALAASEVIVLSLPGSEQVRQVLTGRGGLLDQDLPPRLVVDTTTSEPETTRQLARELAAAGHLLVDAPVSGGPAGARSQRLTVFLGCPPEALERVRQVLAPMAGRITHVGEVGAGTVAKLVNNLLCAVHLAAAAEAWGLATAAGVDPERLLTAINKASGRSAVTEINLPQWVLPGSYDSGFTVGLMARDVTLAEQVAKTLGLNNPVSREAVSRWQQLLDQIGPDADFNRMVQW